MFLARVGERVEGLVVGHGRGVGGGVYSWLETIAQVMALDGSGDGGWGRWGELHAGEMVVAWRDCVSDESWLFNSSGMKDLVEAQRH